MKNNSIISLFVVLASLMQALCAFAQDNTDGRPAQAQKPRTDIKHTTMFGIGATQILDTYISPEHYNGTELRFIDHTQRRKTASPLCCDAIAAPTDYRHWSTDITHQAYFSFTSPRSDDNDNLAGLYTLTIGKHRHWDFLGNRLHIKSGAAAEAGIGFLYNTRNGNNPAQLRLGLNIASSATAAYDFMMFNKRFTLDYGVQIPLLGVMFMPHYGQSYYEIFTRGNYDHNVVLSHPFNTPSMRHALTLQLHLKKVSLRLGYLGDYQQADVNNLKYHNYSHMVVFGITRRLHIVNH